MHNLAHVYKEQGRLEDADRGYEAVLAVLIDVEGRNTESFALTLKQVAVLRLAQGRVDDAEKAATEALATTEATCGVHSETYARIYAIMGSVQLARDAGARTAPVGSICRNKADAVLRTGGSPPVECV